MGAKIKYRGGYKYQLVEDYQFDVGIEGDVDADFFNLHNGILTILKGYAWDGPSGPTLDTKDFMRGSLVHDVFYQMMREGRIAWDSKAFADRLLVQICKEDGMPAWRRAYVWMAVHAFGQPCIETKAEMLTAP